MAARPRQWPVAIILSVVLAASVILGGCAPTAARSDGDSLPITIGESYSLYSEQLGGQREINVWTPPDYRDSGKRYPVLFVVDGGLAQDFHHISGLAQLASINGLYDTPIVVGVGTQNRFVELTTPATDPRYIKTAPPNGGSVQFREHLAAEVMPFIDGRYRTSNRRLLMGESLAGLFVTETFLVRPGLFTDYVAISPSLWWDDKALAKNAGALLGRHDDKPRQLYLTMADEGGTMQGGLDLVLVALRRQAPDGLTLHYVDRRDSEVHSSIYHGAAFDALKKLMGLPAPDDDKTPWYLIEGGQPGDDR